MARKTEQSVKIFNTARDGMSEQNKEILPLATPSNIENLRNIFIGSNYTAVFSDFLGSLVNRIGLTLIRNQSFNNPLSFFKKGSVPLGTTVQEIYTNPVEAEKYEISDSANAKLLKIKKPDTKAVYHELNRQDKYKITYTRAEIAKVFTSWDKFSEFVDSLTTLLYSSNYIDEYDYTKKLISSAYNNNKVIVEKIDDVIDETSAKKFIAKARALYIKMKSPNTKYNSYSLFSPNETPVKTWTNDDRIVIVATADFISTIDVECLAAAFNIDKATLLGRVVQVDEFDNPDIKAILCDESFIQIYSNLLDFSTFYNNETMTWQNYLHVWDTFSISPFANAVVFATDSSLPVTDITWGVSSLDIDLNSQSQKGYDFTLVPSNSNTNIKYIVEDTTIATVKQTSFTHIELTGLKVGTTKLKAYAGNGFSKEITINITNSGE